MKIDEALEAYCLQLQADGRSPHTLEQARFRVGLFAMWIAREKLTPEVEALDHRLVARFLASPTAVTRPDGRPKLPTTTNGLRSTVRCFLRYLHDAGFARENAGRLVRRARCSAPPPRGLSADEVKRLMAVLESGKGRVAERDHLLFHLIVATGLRVSSALGLDVADVDLANGELVVREAKNGQRFTVFLGPRIRVHLARHLARRRAGPLFLSGHGRRMCRRQVQGRLGIWLAKAGVRRPASPHMLRHTFATALYARTGDLGLVQRALCHRSILSTVVYARPDDGRLRAALEA